MPVIESLPDELRAGIVARLPGAQIEELIERVPDFAQRWLAPAPLDAAIELLSRLPRSQRLTLLNELKDPAQKRRLLRHQQYPAHTIGSLVVDIPIRVVDTAVCDDVVNALRRVEGEAPGQLIVTSESGHYVGVLDPWPLLTSPQQGTVRKHLTRLEPLNPETTVADIENDERWNTNAWLPVVDHQQRVMGRVARARVLRVAKDQAEAVTGRQGIVSGLFSELVYLLGSVLERVLRPRDAQ